MNVLILQNHHIMNKLFILSFAFICVLTAFYSQSHTNTPNQKETPTQADSIEIVKYLYDTNIVAPDDPFIYAGRFDETPSTQYNSLALPSDRYWLTSSEWHGEHIKAMDISKNDRDRLMIRFKTWKKIHIDDFIKRMSTVAMDEQRLHGIPASIIIAQSVLESNFGLSRLAVNGNNIFGHKYRGSNKDKFMIVHDDSPTDRFTKFKSEWFSIRCHTLLLKNKYGKRVKSNTVDGWLNALCGGMTLAESKQHVARGGFVYATSCYKGQCYVDKLKNIINTYNLTQYDR